MIFDNGEIKTCQNCKASVARDDDLVLECHLFPPTVVYDPKVNDIVAAFPIVDRDDHCLIGHFN